MEYDVIIAGASFAGLAVAAQIRGRVLVIDRKPIGTGQEAGIHFWWETHLLSQGVGWLFPGSRTSRIGVGSYRGETALGQALEKLLHRFGVGRGALHGGFFPWRLRRPVVDNIFLVGDAAGHCLPFTGEGIRPAMFFGQQCGRLIQDMLEGSKSLEEALLSYSSLVRRYRGLYRLLEAIQRLVCKFGKLWVEGALLMVEMGLVHRLVLGAYHDIFALDPVARGQPARAAA